MRIRYAPRIAILIFVVALLVNPSPIHAWGCKGHQIVALIAEKYLSPEAKDFVEKLLRDNPVNPPSSRYCGGPDFGPLATASTWADDIRLQRPETGPWHYINIPRGADHAAPQKYCGDRGCITRAITEQLLILKDGNAAPAKRTEALRFVIHFVGDLHMPLHASDNNDLGGNCVPIKYLRRSPREYHNTYSPNLHSLWDVAILERDMEGADSPEFARHLEALLSVKAEGWRKAGVHVDEWTWESHDLAESTAYGDLTPKIPVETPLQVVTCVDANHIGDRMFALHVTADEAYQVAAAAVIQERLAQAGVRLAMILNDVASSKSPN
jgi:hypothetical protein